MAIINISDNSFYDQSSIVENLHESPTSVDYDRIIQELCTIKATLQKGQPRILCGRSIGAKQQDQTLGKDFFCGKEPLRAIFQRYFGKFSRSLFEPFAGTITTAPRKNDTAAGPVGRRLYFKGYHIYRVLCFTNLRYSLTAREKRCLATASVICSFSAIAA